MQTSAKFKARAKKTILIILLTKYFFFKNTKELFAYVFQFQNHYSENNHTSLGPTMNKGLFEDFVNRKFRHILYYLLNGPLVE